MQALKHILIELFFFLQKSLGQIDIERRVMALGVPWHTPRGLGHIGVSVGDAPPERTERRGRSGVESVNRWSGNVGENSGDCSLELTRPSFLPFLC